MARGFLDTGALTTGIDLNEGKPDCKYMLVKSKTKQSKNS